MCVKLPPGDLNPISYPTHLTNTYTCGVTIALRVCSGFRVHINSLMFSFLFNAFNFHPEKRNKIK